jgi:hypothetical protein
MPDIASATPAFAESNRSCKYPSLSRYSFYKTEFKSGKNEDQYRKSLPYISNIEVNNGELTPELIRLFPEIEIKSGCDKPGTLIVCFFYRN